MALNGEGVRLKIVQFCIHMFLLTPLSVNEKHREERPKVFGPKKKINVPRIRKSAVKKRLDEIRILCG